MPAKKSFAWKISLKNKQIACPYSIGVVLFFFFYKFCYKQNLSKNEVLHEKRKCGPFRRLYAD